MKRNPIQEFRAFSRFYTTLIGLLDRYLLNSAWSLPEARLIYEIANAKSTQASGIMTNLGIDKSYLSRLLNGLEKEKMIARTPSEKDGRAHVLSLTGKGRRAFEGLNRASDDQIRRLLGPLPEAQQFALVQHMTAIRNLLEAPPKSQPVNIRNILLPGDLGFIAYLHGRLYAREYGYGLEFEGYVLEGLRELISQYDPAKDRVWICEEGDRIIGFLAGVRRKEVIQLRFFILASENRGLGLGKKLMDSFMDYVKASGCSSVYLWTTNEQNTAAELYNRYGFRITEEKVSNGFGKRLVEQRYDLLIHA